MGKSQGVVNCGSTFSHVAASFPMWLQVFPCGCKFSTCRIDKMKSCRHKRQDKILSPQREVGRENVNRGRKASKSHCFTRWGTPYPSRKYPADSAEEAFSEGIFSQWEKGHHNCKSRGQNASRRAVATIRQAERGRRGGRRTLEERWAAAAPATRLLPPPKPVPHQSRMRCSDDQAGGAR